MGYQNLWPPGLYFIILISRQLAISFAVYFAIFTFNLYHKNTKNIILSSLSDLTFASGHEGIANPFITLVGRFLFVCVGAWDSSVVSYWIDTLVLKLREILISTLLHHHFLFKGKTKASSRSSRKNFWHRCWGGSTSSLPSTHHKLSSFALHYLRFASRFPVPHF